MTLRNVANRMSTEIVGRQIEVFDEVASTNDEARRLAAEGAPDGTVVIAERQTAGRGRYGHSWVSLPGSILMTVILRPEAAEVGTICALGVTAACSGIENSTRLAPKIKWPNDVVINDRKLCGAVSEVSTEVLLGIGVNVNADADDFPEELRESATSVREEEGRPVDRENIITAILIELDGLYALWRRGETKVLDQEWESLSDTVGRNVVVLREGLTYEGRVVKISMVEGMLLETDKGDRLWFPYEGTSLIGDW